ncbi:4-(cytidine 5'-diphospho)-2-C-methyl-D-erythritol kinase [soil metagenome]
MVAAPAKVNLTLEVLGRRRDGFHELRSFFAVIDLADRVRVSVARELKVRVVPDPGAGPGEEIAGRAVRAFAAAAGREPRARVSIRKRIPVAAGLGGGSSDAGATLRALATLWRVEPAPAAVAAALGSDVPFFAAGAPFAFVSGRGERVEPLPPPAADLWIALVLPQRRLRTASVFALHSTSARSGEEHTARLVRAFRDGCVYPDVVRASSHNDLLPAVERLHPDIAASRARAAAIGIPLGLSGSGPTLFAIADDRTHAIRIARALRRLDMRARVHRLGVPASERPSALALGFGDGSEGRYDGAPGGPEGRQEHR